jgi:predicted nucleic acid-binding protein
MKALLDTCIVSDIAKRADAGLLTWARAQAPLDLFLSVLSLAEIQQGIDLMADGARRRALRAWLDAELPAQFSGRVLDVDAAVARAYGRFAAAARGRGHPLPVIDGLLLATAHVHDLTLVTRNVRDVEGFGVAVHSPYGGVRP